jgi:starch phosphorylase
MGMLFDRYLDPSWRQEDARSGIWADISLIPDAELWSTHIRSRERLVAFVRQRSRLQIERRGAPPSEIEAADEALNPDALTIGFARRFATYKRATLLFRDLERLASILNHPDRPVQIIFAGKAHPHDTAGKELIREIVHTARREEIRHSLVFLENYDMNSARHLVQGVDIWLNTPRRPKEASGTSGMKVIYNGGINCSILDGWWAEGYTPDVGWAIGNGEEYPDHEWEHQDHIECQALYNILEHDIVPTFYDRTRDGLPRRWIAKVKNAMRTLGPMFTTHRMVQEYTRQLYMPNFERITAMTQPNLDSGLAFAAWRNHLEQLWKQVKITDVHVSETEIAVGAKIEVQAAVQLGQLTPEDVRVQLYGGQLDTFGNIGRNGEVIDMEPVGSNSDGHYEFAARLTYNTSGDRGLSVRVLPHHPFLPTSFLPGLITWA